MGYSRGWSFLFAVIGSIAVFSAIGCIYWRSWNRIAPPSRSAGDDLLTGELRVQWPMSGQEVATSLPEPNTFLMGPNVQVFVPFSSARVLMRFLYSFKPQDQDDPPEYQEAPDPLHIPAQESSLPLNITPCTTATESPQPAAQ